MQWPKRTDLCTGLCNERGRVGLKIIKMIFDFQFADITINDLYLSVKPFEVKPDQGEEMISQKVSYCSPSTPYCGEIGHRNIRHSLYESAK